MGRSGGCISHLGALAPGLRRCLGFAPGGHVLALALLGFLFEARSRLLAGRKLLGLAPGPVRRGTTGKQHDGCGKKTKDR